MEQKQKMIKKSKDMILEVPEYFTHDELVEHYGGRTRYNHEVLLTAPLQLNDMSALDSYR
jgi:hypothetical protein